MDRMEEEEEVGPERGREGGKTIHIEAGGRTLHVTIIADLLEWPRRPSCSEAGRREGERRRETQSELEEEEEEELNRNTTTAAAAAESCCFFGFPPPPPHQMAALHPLEPDWGTKVA